MMRVLLCLLTALFVLPVGVASSKGTHQNLVGNLKSNAIGGSCGCYFQFANAPRNSRGIMFASSAGDRDDTWMNIDGVDTKLKFVSETEPTRVGAQGGERVGSRHTERYSAGDVTVDVLYVVTSVCGPREIHCESMSYSAVFKVRKGNRAQIVRAAGDCGC